MNQVIDAILSRRSVRSYEKRGVDKEALELIVKCGLFAPSAMNKQPWHFTVVQDRTLLDRISEANRQMLLDSGDEKAIEMANAPGYDNFRGAPVAIVVSGENGNSFSEGDCSAAVENMALAAHSLGLSSLYIASFRRGLELEKNARLVKELGVPDGYTPHFALCLGYGNEELGERASRREGTVNWI